ncbi:hypothetical protein KDK88_09275 [bacterium]|nr:hypothetical protein [bacterium]
MNSLEVKKSAEAIAARVWERGGSRDAVMEAVREAFVLDTDGDLCAAVRYAGAWLDAVEAVPESEPDPSHAPIPWQYVVDEAACFHGGNRVSIFHQFEDDGEVFCPTICEVWPATGDGDIADADLIVQAVNHHAALVSALLALVHPSACDDDVNAARALLMDLGALAEGTPSPGEVQP